MSVFAMKSVPCRNCGALQTVQVIQSANPSRHPAFQETLLDRTFNRWVCGVCDHLEVFEGPMLWTDVYADLVAYLAPMSERLGWPQLEIEVGQTLARPVREQGPAFVQAWGKGVAIRLVFGLEELREKVVIRQHRLRDSVIEVLKLPYVDLERGAGPVVESVDDDGIRLAIAPPPDARGAAPAEQRTVAMLSWHEYEQRLTRSDEDALDYPGLFAGTWVHWGRAPFAPLIDTVSSPGS